MSINATVDETTYEGIDTIQTGGKTITLEEVSSGREGFKYHVVKIEQNGPTSSVPNPKPTGFIYLRSDSEEPITDFSTLKSAIMGKQGFGSSGFPDKGNSLSQSPIANGQFWFSGSSNGSYRAITHAIVLYNKLFLLYQDDIDNSKIGLTELYESTLSVLEDNIVTLPIEI